MCAQPRIRRRVSPDTCEQGPVYRRPRWVGEHPARGRAGIYPPAFFSPGPADLIPPYDGGGGRRGNININDTMTSRKGSRAIIASRAVRLILSGIPLSLM